MDRSAGRRGICGETDALRLAVAGLHFGEEPPLTGEGGSGTIFITGCAMGCPFCQNHQISRCRVGREVGRDEFLAVCRALRDAGAENLNLVTPSHMAPTLVDYLAGVRSAGIDLPVAWNSSGFESPEAVRMAAEAVSIWLPDLKTLDGEVAARLYGTPGYPDAARAALPAMADEAEARGGWMMVRHLILPGEGASTRRVLEWFAAELAGRARLSIMSQYTPVRIPGERRAVPEGYVSSEEYDRVLLWLDEFGLEDGYVQELATGDDWLPDFRRSNPFGSELSRILWHWTEGFTPVRSPSR